MQDRMHNRRRRVGLVLGLTMLVLVAAERPAAARCTEKSEIKIKRLNRDALDELDRWRLKQARGKLRDAVLVARARGCLRSSVLAKTYVIQGVVLARDRKYKQMQAAWKKGLCIDPRVKIPRKLQSPKMVRMFKAVRARVKCKVPPRVRPRERHRVRPGARETPRPRPREIKPPKRFEHFPPATWKVGRRLVLVARTAKKLKVRSIKIFYRAAKKGKLTIAQFRRGGPDKWSWTFSLNGVHMYVKTFRYFLVAYAAGGHPVAASGNALQLHVIKTRR